MGYSGLQHGSTSARRALCLALLGTFVLSGCVSWRVTIKSQSTARSNPLAASTTLETISVEARDPLVLDLNINLDGAIPPAMMGATALRLLAADSCRRLAAQRAPTARLLDSDANLDPCGPGDGAAITIAFLAQAEHERNQAAGDALIAFHRLILVYLQNGICLQTLAEIERLQRVLDKLADAGMTGAAQQGQLNQRREDTKVQQARLSYSQHVLTAQLRELLGLDESQFEPIWPVFEATPALVSDGLESEIALAWQHRGDLHALEQLHCLSPQEFLTLAQGILGQTHPLLGLSRVARLMPWQLLMCRHREAIAAEVQKRQAQLAELIEAKRRAIRIEVEEVWHALEMRTQVIAIKQDALAELDADWNRRLNTKDIQPIEMSDEVEYVTARLELIGDLVRERMEIEIDLVRLRKAQGVAAVQ